MKSKALLYVAMVFNIVYAFAMVGIFSSQSWIYELAASDLQEQVIFPVYNIVEAVVRFATVLVLILLLKGNQEQEDNKTELVAVVVMMIGFMIEPLISIFGNALTSQVYAAMAGAESLVAYGILGVYINFADVLGKASMVFVLVYAAIAYGNKTYSDN